MEITFLTNGAKANATVPRRDKQGKMRKKLWFLSKARKSQVNDNPAGNYMFKVNNRNTRTKCEICSKLTIKTPERRKWRRSGVFIVNFEHISQLVLVLLLLTLNK